jgi:tRNA(Ile)-lysidine synthase
VAAPPRVAVATSGGRDSTALLHCTLRQARELGVEVWALHVHHGLMPEADAWMAQVRKRAARWGAAFEGRRIAGAPAAGESVEAWARVQRYRALAEMAAAAGCGLVLLAHHRQDQAETWLLQALRGAGHAGLSAMPRTAQRQGLSWARPWLDLPRAHIEAYVRRHRLQHVDDASNADERFARSRLRQRVWPALVEAFPDAEARLAAAAQHAQEADALAGEVAREDLAGCRGDNGDLAIAPWLALSPARRSNALRTWLRSGLGVAAPQSLALRLLAELPATRSARWPAPGAMLALHRGRLSISELAAPSPPPLAITLDLHRPGRYAVPAWGGQVLVARATQGGVAVNELKQVTLHPRSGGELFRAAPRASARSLKKQFQAQGIPAWARNAPLMSSRDGRLIFVPGLGIDAAFQAQPGSDQRTITWLPDPTGPGQRPD